MPTAKQTTIHGPLKLTATKNVQGKGYTWDASKRTLVLENANIKFVDGQFSFLCRKEITVVLKGNNYIKRTGNGTAAFYIERNDDAETFTFEGNKNSTLIVDGSINVRATEAFRFSGCEVYLAESDTVDYGWQCDNLQNGDFIVSDGAKVTISDGINLGRSMIVDNGTLNLKTAGEHTDYIETHSIEVINGGELYYCNNSGNSVELSTFDFFADSTSTVKLTNEKGPAIEIRPAWPSEIRLLSADLFIKGTPAVFASNTDPEESISFILRNDMEDTYEVITKEKHYSGGTVSGLQYFIVEKGSKIAAEEIVFPAKEDILKKVRLKRGVENTTIQLTSEMAGKRYYYKVRGVRIIDGEKYYTQDSSKAWRTIS